MEKISFLWLFIYTFASFGLTFGMIESNFIEKPRTFIIKLHPILEKLFSCYHCMGFWCSLLMAIFIFKIDLQYYIILGLYGSGIVFLLYKILDLIHYTTEKTKS